MTNKDELNQRVGNAVTRLQDAGFKFDYELKWYYHAAAEIFNSRTLWQVFGLAQILHVDQPLTVRGAFYRAVSSGLFPDTSDSYYSACMRLILLMRRHDLIPYNYIVDSTRRRLKPSSWTGLIDFAETVAQAYRKNLWERQPVCIEFFVEKDAMAGVIEPITESYDVTLNVIRGNCSETFVYRVGEIWQRISKPILAYYLGDHDPNGLKIEIDLRRRLENFVDNPFGWERLAVTEVDFANPDLLGFPVKRNGATSSWQPYLQQFGDRCVEVDAVPAAEIRRRVEAAIMSHINQHEWRTLQLVETEEKRDLLSRLGISQGNR